MCVSRSSFEKPSPFERCIRTLSPSRYSTTSPRRSSSGPTRCAIVVLPEIGRLLPRLLLRRDRGRDHGPALTRQPRGDPADALDVRVAVLLREAEPLREVHPYVVAVEVLDDEPAPVELRPDEVRDRGLARAREPGEPEREAAGPDVRRLRVLGGVDVVGHVPPTGVSRWMPHSSLSEPAQRPARSSSSGLIGRVQGMQPIERKPTSWSGLYGISLTWMYTQTRFSSQSASGCTFQTA